MKIYHHIVDNVVRALEEIFLQQKFADKAIEKYLKSHPKWGSRDRRFFAESVYHTVRHRRLLTYILNGKTDHSYLEMSEWNDLKNLWMVSYLHQHGEFPLLQDETLKPSQEHRERLRAHPPTAIRFSFTNEMDDFGRKIFEKDWATVAEKLNEPADVFLRVNTLKTTREELIARLAAENIEALPVTEIPTAVRLTERKNVFVTKVFRDGFFEVQDAGSQMIAPLLEAEPGLRVMDACAGGGGKSLHIAAMMKNKGRLVAMDIHQWKLDELKKRARRNGVDMIEARMIENSKTIKRFEGSFDRVLLDVPCSGSGVYRRNPDAKWKFSFDELGRLCVLQKEILQGYSKMMKPGGILVYATCSIFPQENQDQVAEFVRENPQWKVTKEMSLRPDLQGFDGFYAAQLRLG